MEDPGADRDANQNLFSRINGPRKQRGKFVLIGMAGGLVAFYLVRWLFG